MDTSIFAPANAAAYAGIGSRETPSAILELMTAIARVLADRGFVLRSGGAQGADSAFAAGASEASSEIFLPWPGFAQLQGRRYAPGLRGNILMESEQFLWREAEGLARSFHPAWDRLSRGARALQTRNTFQVLGPDLVSRSRFVIAWTKDGNATGGTGQAIRIADHLNIPVFNLQRAADRTFVCAALGIDEGPTGSAQRPLGF